MRLARLRVDRLPGIQHGFELTDLDPGLNVVVGPNASGKSSLLRAVRALLYREEQAGAGVVLEGWFVDHDGELHAERVGDDIRWTRAGRPVAAPELPPHHLLDCYLLAVEDLTASGATDDAIGSQLATALRGGYDLAALRAAAPLKLKANHGQSEHRSLQKARRDLHEAEGENRALADSERSLAGWRREVDAAAEARHDAALHRQALELLAARRAAQPKRLELDGFEAGMDRLTGTEAERLAALQDQRAQRDRELDQALVAARAAEAALAASELAERPLTQADLESWRAGLRRLRRLEGDVAAAEARARDARADLETARQDLRSAPPAAGAAATPVTDADRPRLDPATLSDVDQALSDKREIDAELRELGHALEALPAGTDDEPEHGALRTARQALLDLLTGLPSPRWRLFRWLGVALAAGALGGGLALAALEGAATLLLVGLGAVGVAGLALALLPGSRPGARAKALRALHGAGVEPPRGWHREAVHRRLLEVDEAVARAERHERALDERRTAERRREAAEARRGTIERDLQELAGTVGFDPHLLDAGVQRWLRVLDAFQRAETELNRVTAALEEMRPELERQTDALDSFLAEHGATGAGETRTADLLEARLDALAARLTARDEARRDRAQATADRDRIETERARLANDVRSLFDEAAIPPDPEAEAVHVLRRRLERLDAYRTLRAEVEEADLRDRVLAEGLAERPELLALVDADDEIALRRTLDALDATVAREHEALQNITKTETLIERADHDRVLAGARADLQASEEALADRVEEALRAEAGLFLLQAVEEAYEQTSQPAALRRATDWFGRFTRDHYELRFDGRDGSFAAFETASGEQRALHELSTGTRTQLLLAVRIAFATEAERGIEPLPLFLDEALTTADVERFRAVGASLAVLVDEGERQLFYLTARPADAELWRSAGAAFHLIDIARLRTGSATPSDPSALAVPPRPEPPAPDGRTPEAYAAALGVPPIDPWLPPETCHAFHLTRDDLPLLRRLLRAGVEHLGTLRTFLDGPASEVLLEAADRDRLRARIAGGIAYLQAWRRGRGRPVDRAALEKADGVSSAFLDRIDALAQRLQGDAASMLQALENGDVARYRAKDRDQLRDWLEQHGYLDDRAVLDEGALRQQVVAALASAAGDGAVDTSALLAEAAALAAWLAAGIAAGRAGEVRPSLASTAEEPEP